MAQTTYLQLFFASFGTDTLSDAATEPKADKAIPTPKIVEDWSLRLQQAVVASAIYYKDRVGEKSQIKNDSAFLGPLSRKLSNSLASCVALHAGAYEDWTPDGTNVGYMVKIDGTSFLRAPVHLVPLIPEKSYAEIVWRLTNQVRLSYTSIIALSGSNAVRKILQFVDDVDFFEYVPDEPAEIIERLTKRLLTEDTSICERVKIGTTEFSPPYNLDAAKEALRKLDPINDNEATIKLEGTSKNCPEPGAAV